MELKKVIDNKFNIDVKFYNHILHEMGVLWKKQLVQQRL